jgi:hypothetical protein
VALWSGTRRAESDRRVTAYARSIGSGSRAKRAYLIIAPPLFLLLAAWCLSFALTFENCQRACISEGGELALRLASCLVGLILATVAFLAVAAWLSKPRRERMTQLSIRVAGPGLALFVGWLLLAMWASFAVTT